MSTTSFAYVVIAEDGTAGIHRRDVNDDTGIAAILTSAVGGLFAAVRTDYTELSLWCNEEGVPLRLPTNRVGTIVAFLLGGPAQVLLGPVVLTGQRGEDTIGLSGDQANDLVTLAALCHR